VNDTAFPTEAERTLVELIGYSIVSARNLLDETPDYGPIRLLGLVDRLVDASEALGVVPSAWLQGVQAKARSAGRALASGSESFRTFLDELVSMIVAHQTEDQPRGSLSSRSRDEEG